MKSICFIYYLDFYFPFGVTHRMLLLHSHTLSLGCCCQSFTIICLSHSLTDYVSLDLILCYPLQRPPDKPAQVGQQGSKTANQSEHILALSLKSW